MNIYLLLLLLLNYDLITLLIYSQIIPQDHPTLLHRPFIPNQIQEIDQDVNDDRENSSFNDNFYKMKSILLHLGSSFHENTE